MRKIYNDFSAFLFSCSVFGIGLMVVALDHGKHLEYWIATIFLALLGGYVILGCFWSWRMYDSKIYKVWRYGSFQTFCWKDVKSIIPARDDEAVTIWFVDSRREYFLRLGNRGTKDYFEVLKEIVAYIKAANPEIKFPPKIIAQIQKAEKLE